MAELKAGFLEVGQRAAGVLQTEVWVRRYFTLRDSQLSFSEIISSVGTPKKPVGFIQLAGCEVVDTRTARRNHAHAFRVNIADREEAQTRSQPAILRSGRKIILAAASEDEAREWRRAIQAAAALRPPNAPASVRLTSIEWSDTVGGIADPSVLTPGLALTDLSRVQDLSRVHDGDASPRGVAIGSSRVLPESMRSWAESETPLDEDTVMAVEEEASTQAVGALERLLRSSGEVKVKEMGGQWGTGGGKWTTIAAARDGMLYCAPHNATRVLRLNPHTRVVDEMGNSASGERHNFEGSGKWNGIGEGRDGMLYCAPYDAQRVLRLDISTGRADQIGPVFTEGGGKWAGLAAGPDGMLYCAPRSARRVLRIDPGRETADEIGPDLGEGGAKWGGIALAADELLYCAPRHATRVLRIDPGASVAEEQVALVGPRLSSALNKWIGIAPGSDGALYCAPFCADRVLRVDIRTGTATEIGVSLGEQPYKWLYLAEGADGALWSAPFRADRVLRIDTQTQEVELVG